MLQNRDNNNKWRNPGFAIVFHISVLINVCLASFGLIQYQSELFHEKIIIEFNFGFRDVIYLLVVFAISVIFSILWLLFMLSCTNTIIKVSLIFELCMWLVFGALSMFVNPIGVILFIIIAVIRVIVLFWLWKYITFCQSLFTVALSAFKSYWYPVLLHLVVGFFASFILLFDILSFLTLEKIFPAQADPNNISVFSFGFIALVFIYWHASALKGVCHMTSCGVMLQYLNKQTLNMWKKFKLSVTKLFGVICFGTFIEAILRALQFVLGQQERSAARNGNLLQFCCICCLRCLISIIGDILEFINSYTYVYAIKNETDYITSAKSVYNMFKNTGFLSLINEWILFAPLHVGFFLLMSLNVVFMVLSVHFGFIGVDKGVIGAGIGCGFGLVSYLLMMEVIVSYTKTVFVVWAEDRHIFATNQPEYSQILDSGVPAGTVTDQNGDEVSR